VASVKLPIALDGVVRRMLRKIGVLAPQQALQGDVFDQLRLCMSAFEA